mgnify:FL=1
MKPYELLTFESNFDLSGKLISYEYPSNIPFEIRRLYSIYDTSSQLSRGFHAHKTLKQAIFSVHGSVEILLDDGTKKETILLDDPLMCLLIQAPVWREMHNFQDDCVLNVLCDQPYNPLDYIRNYQNFVSFLAQNE